MPVRQKSWGLPVRPPDRSATSKADENELEQQSTEAAVKYWLSEAEKLQPEQRLLFERGAEADNYEDYLSDLTCAVQNTTNSSKISRLSKKMKPVHVLAKSIAPLIASASQINPLPTSLVLGGITCILSASNRFDDFQSKVIEILERMVDEIDVINEYRKGGEFDADPGIKACEINLASDILRFCTDVALIFYDKSGKEKNGLLMAVEAQVNDFDAKFSDVLTHFNLHVRTLEQRRNLVTTRWAKATSIGVKEMSILMERDSQAKKKAIEERLQQRKADEAKDRERRRKEFLDWLPFIDFGEIHENALGRSVEGTGDWLTKEASYKAWSTSRSSAMMWIYGKHGSGKSHLASRIIQKLEIDRINAPALHAVAYVYCTTTQSKSEMTLNKLLGSLLRQLCRQLPPSKDVKDLIPKDDYSSKESPLRSDLKNGILKAISSCHSSSIIVDGLDECSKLDHGHFKEFCDFIASLTGNLSALTKVMILSRPNYSEIDRIMQNVFHIIRVDDGANDDDIEKFISKTISETNPAPSHEELEDFEEIKSKLVNNASGMFLYVRLKMRDFGDIGNAEDIKDSLEDTMEGLDDLYGQAIDTILKKAPRIRERALMALLWITNSQRPLSKMELLEALSLKLKRAGLSSSQRLRPDYQICRQCADLINEVGGFYYLIHGSLQDYLSLRPAGLSEYSTLQLQAHDILAEACLTYLNFDEFQRTGVLLGQAEITTLQQQYPLLHYASSQWGNHYKNASLLGNRGSEISKLSLKLLSVESMVELSLKIIIPSRPGRGAFKHVDPNFYRRPTALHLIAALDLKSLVTLVPSAPRLITHVDHLGWDPLQHILHFKSHTMCVWILEAFRAHPKMLKLVKDDLVGGSYFLLHQVAGRDWDDALRILLSLGCDLNIRNRDGETPLHCAARTGSKRTVEALLAAGADAAMKANDGTTPLIKAVMSKDPQVVKQILSEVRTTVECNANPSEHQTTKADHQQETKHIDHRQNSGNNAFLLACMYGPGIVVELLLEHGADIKATDRLGNNGLHACCFSGQGDVLEVLISRREVAELLHAENEAGLAPLHSSVYGRNLEAAATLLRHGAKPDHYLTALGPVLIVTIICGAFDIAEMLIVNYEIDALDDTDSYPKNSSALLVAARYGWSSILKIIPDFSVRYLLLRKQWIFIHEAARNNQWRFIEEFVSLPFVSDPFPRNDISNTPLHTAALNGAVEVIELLLRHDPSLVRLKDDSLSLPLHFAASKGYYGCVELLLTSDNINERNGAGCTPLWLACQNGHGNVVQFLIEQGADKSFCSQEGVSPFEISFENWHNQIANFLLVSGADCRSTTMKGNTPLHLAAAAGNESIIKYLLDEGHDPLIRDEDGRTPLMSAIIGGWCEAVKLLLSANSEAKQIRDNDGRTCIHFASSLVSPNILEILLTVDHELSQAVDDLGMDAMCHAAMGGRAAMIEILCTYGVPINGAPGSSTSITPLWLAAEGRYPSFIRELAIHGVNLQENLGRSCGSLGQDALNICVVQESIETAYMLLQLGADPTRENRLGLSAVNYASSRPLFKLPLANWIPASHSLPRKVQLRTLRTAIVEDCAKTEMYAIKCMKLPGYNRWRSLQAELLLFNSEASLQYSRLLTIGFYRTFPGRLACFYKCQGLAFMDVKQYFLHYGESQWFPLCLKCHYHHMSCVRNGRPPLLRFFINELERSIQPVLEAIKAFRNHQIRVLWMCLGFIGFITRWLRAMPEAYSICVEESGFPGTFLPGPGRFSGWFLVEVLQRVYSSELFQNGIKNETGIDERGTFEDIVRRDLFDDGLTGLHTVPHYYLPGDNYFECPDIESLPIDEQRHFDGQGQLHKEFFQGMSDYFSSLDLNGIDEPRAISLNPDSETDFKTSPEMNSDAVPETVPPSKSNLLAKPVMLRKMREVLGHEIVGFIPQFMSHQAREEILWNSAQELLAKSDVVYFKRARLHEGSVEFKEANEQIEAYEMSWRLLHSILNIECSQSAWDFWWEGHVCRSSVQKAPGSG